MTQHGYDRGPEPHQPLAGNHMGHPIQRGHTARRAGYPEYVNVLQLPGGDVRVTVRGKPQMGTGERSGHVVEGSLASIDMTPHELYELVYPWIKFVETGKAP